MCLQNHVRLIFKEAFTKLKSGGIFFICELHPFKQYLGGRANFLDNEQIIEPNAFTHHISDYIDTATIQGFELLELKEWFDGATFGEVPRLLSLVFSK